MGLTKTEVNLRRLLTAAPQQQNQRKLIHYVATLRELLEQLAEEKTSEGLPRISKATLNEYLENIEAIAARLAVCEVDLESSAGISQEHSHQDSVIVSPTKGLRRRSVPPSITEHVSRETIGSDPTSPVKLDAGAKMHIQKHRKLQEDLTDKMVDLVRQVKEGSILISHSVQNTERFRIEIRSFPKFQKLVKLLDSTEKAVEHSLASTGHANTRAGEVYTQSSKTSCFTWLLMFAMICIFFMVVLLIRIT